MGVFKWFAGRQAKRDAAALKVRLDGMRAETAQLKAEREAAEVVEWRNLFNRLRRALPYKSEWFCLSGETDSFQRMVEYYENEKVISEAVERCQNHAAAQNNKNRRKEKH